MCGGGVCGGATGRGQARPAPHHAAPRPAAAAHPASLRARDPTTTHVRTRAAASSRFHASDSRYPVCSVRSNSRDSRNNTARPKFVNSKKVMRVPSGGKTI
ncbi:hypothetical protein O0L34_g142 [Tuta absoluta]|nr:hypothetical protein O0L34_g142 [Tuta absoluta]